MLQAESPGGNANVPAFPARVDDGLARSPRSNFASGPENSMRGFPGPGSETEVRPRQADCAGFLATAAGTGVELFCCLCEDREPCVFEVWSLGRRPKRA